MQETFFCNLVVHQRIHNTYRNTSQDQNLQSYILLTSTTYLMHLLQNITSSLITDTPPQEVFNRAAILNFTQNFIRGGLDTPLSFPGPSVPHLLLSPDKSPDDFPAPICPTPVIWVSSIFGSLACFRLSVCRDDRKSGRVSEQARDTKPKLSANSLPISTG